MGRQSLSEEDIFQVARRIATTEARTAYLNQVCDNDAQVREQVEMLLAAHDDASKFLEAPHDAVAECAPTIAQPITEGVGTEIGPYKLLQEIGEGGFGVVYMAEQTKPVHRKVALKIIRLGMDTKQVVARFEAERQALAMMHHPHIAKVLDAGATDSGRPYFVMELVRGVSITEYCDKNKLSTLRRLQLFIPVCQAIQHAHQKGVIHRDIKPSNVMVTLNDGVPHPMVIDFGIAKATHQRLTEKTLFTNYAQMIGTPAYMSPEQAEMSKLDVDTRSDIYSLGVLLYELLTGTTPFPSRQLLSLGYGEMQRVIAEQEPAKPSTRMSTMQDEERTVVAENRSMEASALGRMFQGDLDWIVMKALEKDRTRRYDTVNGFVDDIQRHLNNEPVSAAAPTFRYQLQKFALKNRKYVRAGAAIAGVLVVTSIISSWQAIRAMQAQHEAFVERHKAMEQRRIAEETTEIAKAAQVAERQSRITAEQNEKTANQLLYAADMRGAHEALQREDLDRVIELLERHIPKSDEAVDLRGWEWRYLWQLCQSEATCEVGDLISAVHSLSVSRDGKLVAAGRFGRHDENNGLAVWKLASQERLNNLPNAQGRVRTAFSPTEDLLAFSRQADENDVRHRIVLWNTSSGEIVDEFPLEGTCEGLVFTRNGGTLFVAQCDSEKGANPEKDAIVRYNVSQKSVTATVPSPSLFGYLGLSESFDVDGIGHLAAYTVRGGRSNRGDAVAVKDLRTEQVLWTKQVVSRELVNCLALSDDGSLLATAGGGRVEDPVLWDAKSGERLGQLRGHQARVMELVFWPDGKALATASSDQAIRVWDIADPQRPRLINTLRGCRDQVWQLALHPDRKTLVSGDYDGKIFAWDTTIVRQRAITPPIRDIAATTFASDSQSIIVLHKSGTVSRWSGPEFEFQESLFEAGENLGFCTFLDDEYLATASYDGVVEMWDLKRRKTLYPPRKVVGMWPGVLALDERRVMLPLPSGGPGGSLAVWDLKEDRSLDRRSMQFGAEPFGARSANGWSLTPLDGGAALLENHKTGVKIPVDTGHSVRTAAFSQDGSLFALGNTFVGTGAVFTTSTRKENKVLSANLRPFLQASFSPNNRRLITLGRERAGVHLWDIASGQPLISFPEPPTAPNPTFAMMSPDGNLLLTAAEGGVYIRRAPSWGEISHASRDTSQ